MKQQYIRKPQKRLSKWTVVGVIVLTAVLSSIMLYKQNTLRAQGKVYSSQIEELEKQKDKLVQEKKEIQEYKEYVKTDEYIEEVARDKFGLVYKGEIIFEPEQSK